MSLYEGDAISRMYEADYAILRTPSGDVEFYAGEAVASGGPVLELGCGTGRITIPSARAGVAIAGVDSSPKMLERLRRNLAAEPADVRSRVTVHEGDMARFDPGSGYALVTIPFRALSHVIEIPDQVALLENVRRRLAPGGRLVFDVFNPDPAFLAGPRPESLNVDRMEGESRVRRYSSTRPDRGRQVTDVTFRWEVQQPSGPAEILTSTFPMRWFHRYEMEHLLARCGFRIAALHGDFGRAPLTAGSPEMIFTAVPA